MAKSPPGKVTRGTSRAGIGAGAILVGLALFLLFRGFGPGGTGATGSGTGTESSREGSTMITTAAPSSESSAPRTPLAAPDRVEGGLTEDEKKSLSGDMLTVLIDEHEYLIEIPGSPDSVFRPTPLEGIVELAAMSKGDTNGTRVRILRRQSSRASAEEKLKLELERRGIHKDSVMMPGEFVP